MDSLVSFMTFTKGIEYLIAVAFLLSFIAGWQLVYGQGKAVWMRAAFLLYMAVGVGILIAGRLTIFPG